MDYSEIINFNFLTPIISSTLFGILGFVITGYSLSRVLKRNDVADFLWGLGFFELAFIHSQAVDSLTFRGKLLTSLIFIWSLRLCVHLGIRIFFKTSEDIRYVNMKKSWGDSEPLSAFFKVFLFQGFLMGVIALPIIWGVRAPHLPISSLDFLGVILFIIGFLFESIADAQLVQFKSNPDNKGKVLTSGLWELSRHPNYFGETLIWWGLFFITCSLPYGYWMILSPLTISFLLLKVSGVPMLEKLLISKGEEFAKYTRSTPAFFPFKRKSLIIFISLIGVMIILDYGWLNFFMGDLYKIELSQLGRLEGGSWSPLFWAALLVYFFLALGLQTFVISNCFLSSLFKGSLLGLCFYSVYELTNLALIKNWPFQLALVDIIWGTVLCGGASFVGSILKRKMS